MTRSIHKDDLVEVLSCYFSGIVGHRGIVQEVLAGTQSVVNFPTSRRFQDAATMEVFQGTSWFIPCKYLKVLDSPRDDAMGVLEEKIQDLEMDLVVARSCLGLSEDLRDQQQELIQKLIEDIDVLRKELYLLKGN